MSFNRTLWKLTGRQIGREARALMNAGNGYSTFWAPVVNLAREPRWGRNIETPGEDPFLTGQYAKYPVVIINWVQYLGPREASPSGRLAPWPGWSQAAPCHQHSHGWAEQRAPKIQSQASMQARQARRWRPRSPSRREPAQTDAWALHLLGPY